MIKKVLISDDLILFLEKRNLTDQYKKTKKFLLQGMYRQVKFKLRKPKKYGIYYFRINRQFRALCRLDGEILKVFDIDNHQN